MSPFYVKSRHLMLTLALASMSCSQAVAGPFPVQLALTKGADLPTIAARYRSHLSPWQAPYHTSRWYRGGPGAHMGLVAQGILPPPRRPHYDYAPFYSYNYFYYPNYRMIYDF